MATTTWPAEVYVFDGTHWVSISPHGMSTLPPATGTTIGGVIVGAGINVAPDGTISVTHFSGDYNDLTNKPIIPAPVQSDWLATGGDAFIVNKPNFLSQFTNDLKVSAFPNDALYVDAAAAAAAAPIQSIAAGANVAISDDGHGNIVIAATGGGGGTPGGVVSVSGTAPIKVVDGLNAPVISLVLGTGLKVNSGALEADFSGFATVATSGSYNDLSDKPTIPPAYTLPTASGTVLGGVKVGTGLTMTGEVLSATGTTVPDASTTTKGIIQIADSAAITAGTASRAVDAAGLKTVTDQQAKDYVNVSGDTMTGTLVVPDGTAAAPSLKFDDATGVYQPAANTWAVSTAGVERLRVRADGNVGIGVAGAANILIDGKTDQAFLARLESTNNYSTGLYDGRCGYRIANATNGPFYCEMYLDPTARTYGFGGSSSGGSLPIIGGVAQADIVVSPKNWVAFNEPALAPLGTASAPSVSISGDTDTGTFSPAANAWAVSTGGVERLRVANTIATFTIPFAVNCSTASWAYATSTSPTAYMKLSAAGSSDYWFGVSGVDDEFLVLSGTGASQKLFSVGQDGYVTAEKGSGGFLSHGGSAVAPAVSIIGDEDTGIFSPAANTWAVSAGGVERLRVRADGNVGIGGSGGGTSKVAVQGLLSSTGAIFGVNNIMQGQCDGGIIYAYAAAPSITGTPANVYCYAVGVLGSTAANANRIVGFRVDATEWSARAKDSNYGLWATVNTESGKTNYAIFAGGTAPSFFGGQVQTNAGSAASPTVSFAHSEDTGTFSPGANTWAVSTAGVERLRVKSTGGVKYVPLATAPATPDEGEVYFDSTTKKLRVYDGTAWADLH